MFCLVAVSKMPFFNKKENKKVNEKSLAVSTGNASGYQKTEEYRKGNTSKAFNF